MQYGVYLEIESPTNGDHVRIINDVIRLVEQMDQLGFDVFTTIEHPFYENFSISADPIALFAALAQRTQRIRFRACCHTIPLHNPMVLAGQLALLDILTGGRIETGFGRGHAWLQNESNVSFEENNERYAEGLEIILQGLRDGVVNFHGKYYNCHNLPIVPRAIQRPPKFFQVGTSTKQMPRSARNGWGAVLGGPVPAGPFLEAVRFYKDQCREFGTKPHLGWAKAVFIAEDHDTAYREGEQYALDFIKYNFSPFHNVPRGTETERERLRAAGYGFYADCDKTVLPMLDWSYDKLVETDAVIVGTPEEVAEGLLRLHQQVEYDELLIISHYGDMPLDKAMRNQQLFAEKVRPLLDARLKGS